MEMRVVDARTVPRKILRVRAKIVAGQAAVVTGKTFDISDHGVCLMLPAPLRVGAHCMFACDLMLPQGLQPFQAEARVVYAILSGTEGYRTGLEFVQPTAHHRSLIAALPGAFL